MVAICKIAFYTNTALLRRTLMEKEKFDLLMIKQGRPKNHISNLKKLWPDTFI